MPTPITDEVQQFREVNQVLNDALDLARAAGERGVEASSIVLGLVSAAVAITKHNGQPIDMVKSAADLAAVCMEERPADPRTEPG